NCRSTPSRANSMPTAHTPVNGGICGGGRAESAGAQPPKGREQLPPTARAGAQARVRTGDHVQPVEPCETQRPIRLDKSARTCARPLWLDPLGPSDESGRMTKLLSRAPRLSRVGRRAR